MKNFERCIKTLELKKILQQVSEFACLDETKNLILNSVPITNLQMVSTKLNETDEAMAFLERGEALDLFEIKSPIKFLRQLKTGSFLNQAEILNIGLILNQVRFILNFYDNNLKFVKFLKKHFLQLSRIDTLEKSILNSIESEEFVADEASENLKLIRASIVAKKSQIKTILQNYINGPNKQYIQDDIITTKNGRYVLAVKSQFKEKVPGLLQDVSSSKATVFIEPSEVVGCCNDLKMLFAKEKAEIELILKNLSLKCAEHSNEIEQNYYAMVNFDLIFAKAKFSLQLGCSKPVVVADGTIDLLSARHPLIDKNEVVPINIKLGGSFKNLIISGPNTGGKTVALKTVGLLSLMAMCGLLIPSSGSSKISIFKKILVLIGDEQSIESSLSTFSAHMTHLAEILRAVDDKSLVLVDEICGGTDPQQGAALAVSVVENLCKLGACFAITTHYMQLKLFAQKSEYVENASFEFDEHSLSPTYRLKIGFFGQSSAFQISKKIGISNEIIIRAKHLIDEKRLEFDRVIEEFGRAKLKYEKNLKIQKDKIKELDELKLKIKEKQKQIESSADDYLEKARQQANETLKLLQAQANTILNELKKLDTKIKTDENIKQALARAKSISKNSVNGLIKKFSFKNEATIEEIDEVPINLKKGDKVLIYDLDKSGIVLDGSEKNGSVLVEIGMMKLRIETKRLKLIKSADSKTNLRIGRNFASNKHRKIETSVDLRGQTAIDAIFMVDRAIDSCLLSNVSVLSIIHGKGAGILRNSVNKHLKTHKNVKSQRLGDYYEGGDGVTIVELN